MTILTVTSPTVGMNEGTDIDLGLGPTQISVSVQLGMYVEACMSIQSSRHLRWLPYYGVRGRVGCDGAGRCRRRPSKSQMSPPVGLTWVEQARGHPLMVGDSQRSVAGPGR